MQKVMLFALKSLIIYCCILFAHAQTTTGPVKTIPPLPSTITTDNQSTTIIITPKSPIDDDIITAVYAKFAKTPALIGTKITANSVNGVVTLNGTVTAQSQADAAVEAAKTISAVKDVRSEIVVTTNPDLNKPNPAANY